jgi:hypothetical protein
MVLRNSLSQKSFSPKWPVLNDLSPWETSPFPQPWVLPENCCTLVKAQRPAAKILRRRRAMRRVGVWCRWLLCTCFLVANCYSVLHCIAWFPNTSSVPQSEGSLVESSWCQNDYYPRRVLNSGKEGRVFLLLCYQHNPGMMGVGRSNSSQRANGMLIRIMLNGWNELRWNYLLLGFWGSVSKN